MSNALFASPANPVHAHAALAPAHNALLSLWALTADAAPPVEPAFAELAAQLAPEARLQSLALRPQGAALTPAADATSFEAYLDALAEKPATAFAAPRDASDATAPTLDAALPADPTALQQRVVDHLRTVWHNLVAAEWARQAPLLAKLTSSVNEVVCSQPAWSAADGYATLRFLLQTEPAGDQLQQLAGVQRIILVWSPHVLAWCSRFGSADTLWVLRKFDPQLLRRDPLTRAEVLGPLSALADDTRLRILELLIENGEQRAQAIISQLDGSQGNVSRHLKQLVNGGFVRERRAGDANKLYAFNQAGVQRLMYLTRQLLSSDNAQSIGQRLQAETRLNQARAGVPAILQPFLDESGRITRWSSKLKDQDAMLAYLIGKFELERGYTEKEVNTLLQRWYLDADFVLVRRTMVDTDLLKRTRDGSRYWVEAAPTTEAA
ncbi:MAG: DUF2087 domain-containing protein [Anaerolineales bacterium]|nr:DUF2087 domain-containing protein [Anaerolineales bacterium]